MGLIACTPANIGLAFFTVVASNQIFPQGKITKKLFQMMSDSE